MQTFLLEHVFVTCSIHHLFVCQLASFQKCTIKKVNFFYHCDIFLCCCHTLMEIWPFHNIFWKYLGNIRLCFFWIYWQNCSWLQSGHANDLFIPPPAPPIQSNIVVLANGYINMAVFILSRRYVSCNVSTSETVALEWVWVLGMDCWAGGVCGWR